MEQNVRLRELFIAQLVEGGIYCLHRGEEDDVGGLVQNALARDAVDIVHPRDASNVCQDATIQRLQWLPLVRVKNTD